MRYASSLRRLSFDAAMTQIGRAWNWLKTGEHGLAHRLLGELIAQEPAFPPARELMAYALQMRGELGGAEEQIRRAIALDGREPAFWTALAGILAAQGDGRGAEVAFRSALAEDRRFLPAVEGLATLLLDDGRPEDALATLAPVTTLDGMQPSLAWLQVRTLRALERLEEALSVLAGLQAALPGNAEVATAQASVQEDLGAMAEAEASTRRAVRLGADDAAQQSRLGRLLQAQGRFEEAEAAYRQALDRQPEDGAVHSALVELIWMRTGDPRKALAPLDAALAARPALPLRIVKSRLLGHLGQAEAAYRLLAEAAADRPGDAGLHLAAAARAAAAGRLADMLGHARAAQALRPDDKAVRTTVADALVRRGDFAAACEILSPLLAADPDDQQAITLQALAWRGLDDPRYRTLYDYDRLVRAAAIPVPEGWRDLDDYLAELSSVLHAMHRFDAHPLSQSLRGGTQTSHNLTLSREPAIRAFFQAVREPIGAYIAAIEPAAGRRPRPDHRIAGAWSVKLRPDGFHVSHMHPDGWISSAFYVEVPAAVDGPDRPGWLQFGDPGGAMASPMEPDHFVRPAPGTLVLFPSYMLHGTRPFPGPDSRLTIAFDLVRPGPAPPR